MDKDDKRPLIIVTISLVCIMCFVVATFPLTYYIVRRMEQHVLDTTTPVLPVSVRRSQFNTVNTLDLNDNNDNDEGDGNRHHGRRDDGGGGGGGDDTWGDVHFPNRSERPASQAQQPPDYFSQVAGTSAPLKAHLNPRQAYGSFAPGNMFQETMEMVGRGRPEEQARGNLGDYTYADGPSLYTSYL